MSEHVRWQCLSCGESGPFVPSITRATELGRQHKPTHAVEVVIYKGVACTCEGEHFH